jgi:hypothetical protein
VAAYNVQFFSFPNAFRETLVAHDIFGELKKVKLILQGGVPMNATSSIGNKILWED